MKFRGDQSAEYSKRTGSGTIGKVVGPNMLGQYFVIMEATYDAETDTTYVETQLLPDPRQALERIQS